MRRQYLPLLLLVGLAVLGAGREAAPRSAEAAVRRVVDGDTIELTDGRLVRYIGIDAPEARRKRGGRWVRDPDPYSAQATETNQRLVGGKRVRLEFDVQTRDRYGRVLAYVYVPTGEGREVMVNEELLRAGVAQLLTIPPNVKYAEQFRAFAEDARQQRRGLWRDGRPAPR